MEAAFYLSHQPSISYLPAPKSSVSLFNFNRTLSYSSRLVATNYKEHSNSNFPISLITTVTRPQRHAHVFHRTTCAIDDGRVPARNNDKGNEDKKKPGAIVRSATVVLACTMLGIIMSSNSRLIQAKALTSYFSSGNKATTSTPMTSTSLTIQQIKEKLSSMGPEEAITMLESEYKACEEQDKDKANKIDWMLVERLTVQGDYKDALARKCLSSVKLVGDVDSLPDKETRLKVCLYKTFLYAMTNKKMQAETWFQAWLGEI